MRAALVGLVAALLITMTAVPQAMAYLGPQTATSPGFIGINGQHEMGTMTPPALGRRVICIDESGGGAGFRDYPHAATTSSQDENWPAAYALEHYLNTSDDHYAAALYFYVGYVLGLNSNPAEVLRAWNAGAAAGKWADSTAQFNALVNDVNANAGPYSMDQLVLMKTTATGGTVSGVGIQSGAGVWQAGHSITVTLEGPALFDATGTTTMTVTSTGAPQTFGFHFTGSGEVKVGQATTGLPRYIDVYPAPAAGQQRVVASSALSPLEYRDPVALDVNLVKATSQVSHQLVTAGSSLTDTVVVTDGITNMRWTGTVTVYGPLASHPSGGLPTGAPVVAVLPITGAFDASGATTVTTDAVEAPARGYYYFQEHINESPIGVDLNPGAQWAAYDAPYEVSETALVMAPTLSTQVSSQQALAGATIHDTARISDAPATDVNGQPINYAVSGSLLGPVAPVAGACAGVNWAGAAVALAIASTPVPAGATSIDVGSYTIPAATPTSCYTYVLTLDWVGVDASELAGIGRGSVTHAAGLAAETALATARPKVTTTVSAQLVMPGSVLTDTATVTGTSPLYDYKLTGALYGPVNAGPNGCTDVDWTGAAALSTIPSTTVATDGPVTVGAYTVPADATIGCMSYGEQLLVLDKTTGSTLATIDHPVGQVTQTSLVIVPAMSTQISSQLVVEGAVVIDTATLKGLAPVGPDGTPISYSLSGALLGPVTPVGEGCSSVDWTGAKTALTIAPTTVAAEATTVQVGQYQIPVGQVGCYGYTLHLTATAADGSTVAVGHAVGVAEETAVVVKGAGGSGDGGQIEAGQPGPIPWLWGLVLVAAVGTVRRGLRKVRGLA